jgi:hypothetical protein
MEPRTWTAQILAQLVLSGASYISSSKTVFSYSIAIFNFHIAGRKKKNWCTGICYLMKISAVKGLIAQLSSYKCTNSA